MVLMLREEGTHWEPPTIVEAITELKNWEWEGAVHLMEDFVKKIKTIEPITLAKDIVFIPIKSVSTSITVPIKSVYDRIPIEFVSIKSIENSFSYNVISNSHYFLALNVFISEIGKETLNNRN